jgi:hypothetical protein
MGGYKTKVIAAALEIGACASIGGRSVTDDTLLLRAHTKVERVKF